MKKTFAILFAALAVQVTAYADNQDAGIIQKMTTKNGSVLYGYIEQQDGKGNLTFHSDSAFIYVENKNISITERSVAINNLDKVWANWAESHDAFIGVGDSRTFVLNDIVNNAAYVKDTTVAAKDEVNSLLRNRSTVSNVKVTEKGVKIKYVELTPNTYTLSWKDVITIKAERRAKTALSGINRIFQLRNGESYEGQYAEETYSTISLYLPDGVMQTFNINDIVKYTYRPLNPNQDIFEQSELIDVIMEKNGSPTRGIIIEQNYSSKKDTENYLLVREENGTIKSIRVTDIQNVRKERNDKKYAPQFDIILKKGEVVINRQATNTVVVKEAKGVLTLDGFDEKNTMTIEKGQNNSTKIIVEYSNEAGSNVDPFQLVKVAKTTVKKKTSYTFTYKDLVDAIYRPLKMETSVNQTTKAEYTVGGDGIFVLYDSKNKKAIPFIVK